MNVRKRESESHAIAENSAIANSYSHKTQSESTQHNENYITVGLCATAAAAAATAAVTAATVVVP